MMKKCNLKWSEHMLDLRTENVGNDPGTNKLNEVLP